MKPISLVNGKFEDKISVFDRGLAYGDGFLKQWLGKRKIKQEIFL